MVSFFGIKFGADKKKKEPEQAENSLYAQQWKASREEVLRQCSGMPGAGNRPSTAQGSLKGGAKSHTSVGSESIWDNDSRGSGAGFLGTSTSVTALSGPLTSHSLKPFASEANLKTNLGAMNASSSSLATAKLPLGGVSGGGSSETGPRPGSAHSTRQGPPATAPGQAKPFLRPLDVHGLKDAAPGVAGTPRSPLGQFELMSPVSDSESLLGEEPDKIAKEISNRITREEEQTKSKTDAEERNRAQAELRSQAMRNVDPSRPYSAKGYPSPPASIGSIHGDRDAASTRASGPKPNAILKGPIPQDLRPGSRGRDVPSSPLRPMTGPPRIQQPITDRGRSDSRGRPSPTIERPLPSPNRGPLRGPLAGSDPRSVSRGRSQTADDLTPGSSTLRPQGSQEPPARGTTGPVVKPPPRSPLFQQSSPVDLPKVNEFDGDENKLTVDYRPTHDRYGIPSPPLSNGQCSGEETESRPVIRTVQAKRDTLIIDANRRGSLGLQIDEFEKTLQQAQAMTALEKGPDSMPSAGGGGGGGARSRGNSDGSSNYSDVSESPMTIEPPLISPQPFPLTPRPMSPATRSSKPNLAEILSSSGRPTLEERSVSSAGSSRSNTTPVGSIRSNKADGTRPVRPVLEIRPESPANRPRLIGPAPPRRPTLEEYGIRINTAGVGSMDSRIGRPSPDGFDARLNLAESPDRTDSPTLKNVRNVFSPEQMSEAPSSADTSRSNSPVAAHHSVFSPPPPAKRALPPPSRTVRTEWDLGPAPTAPPTTPLPIPEKNARRRAAERSQSPLPPPTPVTSRPVQTTTPVVVAGLASSASIVPDIASNPNWPLPGPATGPAPRSVSPGSFEGSFSARRSLLPDRRAPPAPLNIAATKYADDVGGVADMGSAGLDVDTGDDDDEGGGAAGDTAGAAAMGLTPIMRPQTAGVSKDGGAGEVAGRRDSLGMGDGGFVWRDERTTVYDTAKDEDEEAEEEEGGDVFGQLPIMGAPATPAYDVGDKSCAIGVARGLSIKYDQMREQEKRARAKDRMKAMRAWGAVEEATPASGGGPLMSPPSRVVGGAGLVKQQSVEGLRTAMHGLRSPTGIADEHGTGFI